MSDKTHYEVLGVSRTADRETIRKAYIALARASHPDRQQPGASRGQSESRIRAANAAWNELRDPVRRREYDLSLPDSRAASAPASSQPNLADRRPPPPSGIVVSAHTAPLWKWGPVVVAVLIGAALIIGSAYATSQDPSTATSPTPVTQVSYQPGQCVLIVAGPAGKIAQTVECGRQFSALIAAVVDSPRPCPASTATVPLYDGKTTLCLSPTQ